MRRSGARRGKTLLPLAMLCAAGCGQVADPAATGGESTAAAAPRPNVLLVTLDTVRADRTSLYGYDRDTTPFLRELAAEGVRFDRAYSVSSWTVPSIVSLMTSLEPATHGVNRGYVSDIGSVVRQQVLEDRHLTLAEILRDAGYTTLAVTANGHLSSRFGFAQGFKRYDNVGFAEAPRVEAALDRIAVELGGRGPWFLWVHYFDPHGPFRAMAPAIDEYLSDETDLDTSLLEALQQMDHDDLGELGIRPGDRNHRYVTALYDSEIRYTDGMVRDLLERVPLTDHDLVIVTADHGEEFGDHGDCGHGHSLYEEVVRVPLVVRLPGGLHARRVVTHPVSGLDVLPTITEVLGLDTPDGAQGHSLLGARPPVRTSLAKVGMYEAWIEARYKYIHDLESGEHALFDLSEDPRELRNLVETRSALAERLRRMLEESTPGNTLTAGSIPIDPRQVDELRSLGYLD